jgi:hypothetical protein
VQKASQRRADRIGHVGARLAERVGELAVSHEPRGDILPARGALELGQQTGHAPEERLHGVRVGLQPHEVRQTPQPGDEQVRRFHVAAHLGDGLARLAVDRQVERRELREALGRDGVDPHQLLGIPVDTRPLRAVVRQPSVPHARPHPGIEQGRHRLPALGRQVDPIQRGRQHLGRGRLEIEQQAERLGEIDVRELLEHPAIGGSFQRPADGPLEK